jgi:hypothetical protein
MLALGRRERFGPKTHIKSDLWPTLGHYPRLSFVFLVGEALNLLEQHLGVAGQDGPIDTLAPIPER